MFKINNLHNRQHRFNWGVVPNKHKVTKCNIVDRMCIYPDSKVSGANMGPTWELPAPDGPHVDPMNLAIRVPPATAAIDASWSIPISIYQYENSISNITKLFYLWILNTQVKLHCLSRNFHDHLRQPHHLKLHWGRLKITQIVLQHDASGTVPSRFNTTKIRIVITHNPFLTNALWGIFSKLKYIYIYIYKSTIYFLSMHLLYCMQYRIVILHTI